MSGMRSVVCGAPAAGRRPRSCDPYGAFAAVLPGLSSRSGGGGSHPGISWMRSEEAWGLAACAGVVELGLLGGGCCLCFGLCLLLVVVVAEGLQVRRRVVVTWSDVVGVRGGCSAPFKVAVRRVVDELFAAVSGSFEGGALQGGPVGG